MTQKKTILSELFLAALATTRSLAVNPEICNSDSSKCYKLYTDEAIKFSSEEARVACNGMGHDLAYFETNDEYEAFLTAAADAQNTGDKEVWVNGYRISGVPNSEISFEAKLSDSSTKPFDDLYHSWAPGQPNNKLVTINNGLVTIFSQNCMEVRFDDTDTTFFQNMNDVRCSDEKSSYACVRTAETPGVGGDPHFKTFNGKLYSYHGECDLVLMHSKMFESGTGIRVHVRTTRVDTIREVSYSYVSGAAVQVGDNVLEASEDGTITIDNLPTTFTNTSISSTSSTATFAGYTLTRTMKGRKGHIFSFELNLGNSNVIKIRTNTKTRMMYVDVEGHYEGSVGLLGAPAGEDDRLRSRDGSLDLTGNWNSFGEEWQVNDQDPMLFQDAREPQYPVTCLYDESPEKKNLRHRRLLDNGASIKKAMDLEAAMAACASTIVEQIRQFCIEDVMATGDLELASDPFYN